MSKRRTGRSAGRSLVISAGAIGIAVAAGGCGGTQSSSVSGGAAAPSSCPAGAHGQSAATASYVVSLDVGPVEQMYSPAQVAATHPASGEVMLRGGMDVMASGPAAQHLEAHICSRTTGAVVPDASPTILLRDTTAGSAATIVPVAVMQGVTGGSSDLHYGNNVVLAAGHAYQVTVRLNGESAVLPVTAG